MRRLVHRRLRLSERHPSLYPLAVWVNRCRRRMQWLRAHEVWAARREPESFPVRVKVHKSLLLRQLGDSEMYLQHNKVTNLRLAAQAGRGADPARVRRSPSIGWSATARGARATSRGCGCRTARRSPGVGGGICQLANLHPLDGAALGPHGHRALRALLRPVPGQRPRAAVGDGCSIVYNYVDLQLRNDTDGDLPAAGPVGRPVSGRRAARRSRAGARPTRSSPGNERFYRLGAEYFRANEIWRAVIDRRTGNTDRARSWCGSNCALVKYVPVGRDRWSSSPTPGTDRVADRSYHGGSLPGATGASSVGRCFWRRPTAPVLSGARHRRRVVPLGYGVIGSPTGSGPVSLGSSPSTPATRLCRS